MVFAMSKAIGKYMKNSGLNKRLSDCGIYNPLAVEKISRNRAVPQQAVMEMIHTMLLLRGVHPVFLL